MRKLTLSVLQIGFASVIVAAVSAILALGKPVVDYTFSVFPTGASAEEGLYREEGLYIP